MTTSIKTLGFMPEHHLYIILIANKWTFEVQVYFDINAIVLNKEIQRQAAWRGKRKISKE